MDSLNDIWNQVLLLCKAEVSDVMYNMWLAPLEFKKLDESSAVFTVNAEYKKTIVMNKFSGLLKRCFFETIGFEIDIDIIVNEAVGSKKEIDNVSAEILPAEKKEEKKEISAPVKNTLEYYTFDNFIVGSSNFLAYAMAKNVVEAPALHNPFLIYGNSGLGKTHLLYAIYNELKRRNPNAVVIYITAKKFLDGFQEALNKKTANDFLSNFKNVDALLIDDVQTLKSTEKTQVEFFHIFEALYNDSKQIVLTADVAPKEIDGLDERLRSRFEMGLIADIKSPDIETRKAIVMRKSELLDIKLTDTAVQYIAEKIKNNIRQIEGTLNKIEAMSRIYGKMPSFEQIQTIVKEVTSDSVPVTTVVEKVFTAVSNDMGISVEDIKSQSRQQKISKARNICMYVIKDILKDITYQEIGDFFGKDHATVLHSLKKIKSAVETDQLLKNSVNSIIKQVKEM